MGDLIGPLSDGNVLLQLAVLLGVAFAAIAWEIAGLVGIRPSSVNRAVFLIGGFVLGIGTIFFGHVLWHYRLSRGSDR